MQLLLASFVVRPVLAVPPPPSLYVATGGSDSSNNCQNSASPCKTIAYAITQASSGAAIYIAASTYPENLTPNKNLYFYGSGMNATILDGGGLNTVITDNSYNLTIADMTIRNGYTTGDGGGIAQWGGVLTLSNVKVTGNVAESGGGIDSSSTLTITDSVVSNNSANTDTSGDGGGLFLGGGAADTVSLTRVTINGNLATYYSGGIHNQGSGTLNLTNVTINGNTAKIYGSMVNTNHATTTIVNSTIAGNHFSAGGASGGISNFATIKFMNTIIAGNDCNNCYNGTGGTWTSLGHNLDSGSTCNFTQPGDLQNTDPKLGPLADNGDTTQTMALLTGSPAIDAGEDSGSPATDQRGVSRPGGLHCDIGAYEAIRFLIYLPLVIR